MSTKILVTGATGGLGSKVFKLLREKTAIENLAVLVRDEKHELTNQYTKDGIDVRIGDYANINSLENALKDIDVLYFVSGGDDDKRAILHKNVVDAAKKTGVKHLLYTSSMWKDESDASTLASLVDSHRQTEKFIKSSGINYTICKHNLYAEVIGMLIGDRNQLSKTKSIYLPTENGLVSFVPKDDYAEAEVNILLNLSAFKNKVLEFNGSEQINFSQIAEKLSGILDQPIHYSSPEIGEFKSTMNKLGIPNRVVEILSTFSLAIAEGEFDQQSNDLEAVLGRKTKSLLEFLTEAFK